MAVLANKATLTYNLLGVPITVDSNTVNFNTVANVATVTKAFNPTAGKSGDTTQVSVTILATSLIATATLTDLIPTGLTFVAGTVKINGTAVPSANPNTGIPLTNILLGVNMVVTFDCTVD